jgi:hypothetical protein
LALAVCIGRLSTGTVNQTDIGMSGTRERSGMMWLLLADQNVIECPGRNRVDKAREGTPGTYTDAPPVSIRLGALRIGSVAFASIDAEVYSPIANRLKQLSPVANTVVVTLANGRANSGYIPNDAAFNAYTFQVLGSSKAGLRRNCYRRRPAGLDPGRRKIV